MFALLHHGADALDQQRVYSLSSKIAVVPNEPWPGTTTAGFSDRSILVAVSISAMVTNGQPLLRLFGIATDEANSTRSAGSHTAVSASLCAFFR